MENAKRESILATLGLANKAKKAKPDKKIQQYIDKAYYDAIYDSYKAIFKHQLAYDFYSEGIIPLDPKDERMAKTIERARERNITKPRNVLLTVNVKPGVSFEELRAKVEKFVNRTIIKHYHYAYEIRKEGGEGLHCHMMLRYDCKPYDLKRSAQSTFNSVCQVKNPSILNIRWVEDEDVQSKIEYLSGNKQDKKIIAVKLTLEWRKKHGIKDLYSTPLETPEFPLLGYEEIAKTI